jgi:hypothetical protein
MWSTVALRTDQEGEATWYCKEATGGERPYAMSMYSPARSDYQTELTPVEVQLRFYYSSLCRLRQYLLLQLF